MNARYGVKSYGKWDFFKTKGEYENHLKHLITNTYGAERDRFVNAMIALWKGKKHFDTDSEGWM